MSRTTQRDNAASFTLFPFIAVLLCTMGGLAVLLVSMAHVSEQLAQRDKQAQAAQREQAEAPESPPHAKERSPTREPTDEDAAKSMAQVKAAQLKLAEAERRATQHLHDEQLRLAQIEEHVRKLRETDAALMAAAHRLISRESQRLEDRAAAERRVAQLERLRKDTADEIRELKQHAGAMKSYSVVPYKGPNGTRRPPIYIECLPGKIVLQPEGVVFGPEDFAGPLGVGNPLAAALRAAREYHMRNNPSAGTDPDAEPYPLIIVRQGGIGEYYDVRRALKSWESDFGYEMVDDEWKVDYGAPNPELSSIEAEAVEIARRRRSMLAQAAPSAFRGTGVRGAGSDSHGAGGFDGQPYETGGLGGGYVDRSDLGADGEPGSAGVTRGGGQADIERSGFGGGGGEAALYPHGAGGPAGGDARTASAGRAGAQGDQSGTVDTRQAGAQQSQDGAPRGGAAQAARSAGKQDADGAEMEGSGARAGAVSGAISQRNAARAASLNRKESPKDVAIRRGVPLTVFADRVLVGEDAVSVPLGGPTHEHFGDVVDAVGRHVRAWGIAGEGLYWRPVIRLDVRNGGELRAEEIARGLSSGGVDVEFTRTAGRAGEETGHETR